MKAYPELTLMISLMVASSVSLQLRAENWPGWRGPKGDGHTTEQNLPVRWSATENVLWKIPIAGSGHSSPIVWEDSVFITTCYNDIQSRRLLKLDCGTGKVLWDREIAVSPIEEMHRDNSPASATPVTDGKLVYVVFLVNGGLEVSAIDFAGEKVWTNRVGSFEASHGFCSNLVLDGNRIFLSGLQDGPDAFVAALDKGSGEVLWKVPRAKRVRSYSTPLLCSIHSRPALMLSGAEQTVAYDRGTGETIWAMDGPGSKTVSSIVACDQSDLAFVCGGRDNQFFAVPMNSHQPTVAGPPSIAWKAIKGIPYMTSPLLSKGKLHILSDEGIYRCYDPVSGRVLKEVRAVGATQSSMIASGDHIYITETSGRTTVVKNDEHWTVVAENDLNERVVSSLAASNGVLFIRTASSLIAVGNR
ncbi:MAG: PQQ-binding-like beta-propeller repeat protein [Pirellulaceae bacterium]|nr:PQQ-binding-like beta-propeller repeat protein [Pirellulaceae bacterium]